MIGRHKKFDKELFEENNHAAIARVLQHVNDLGLFASLNEDIYGPDIVVYSGFRKVSYVEVERKRVWKGAEFPWITVQLPERKGKFLKKRLPIEFWLLNESMDHVVIIPDFTLLKERLVEIRNVLVPDGELFYQVPVSECIIKQL